MKDNKWVKLHYTVLDNDIWRNDRTAWHVFEYLLICAYIDKRYPLGKMVTTRRQIAEVVGSNHNTVYKAIKRLEKAKMVTTKVTNQYTMFTICNWGKYQSGSNQDSNNEVTTDEQRSNSLNKTIDNRLKNITNVMVEQPQYGNSDVNTVIEKFESTYKLKLNKTKQNRIAATNLIKRYGLEQTLRAIEAASMCLQDQYAPSIVNLMDLHEKYDKLRVYYARQTKPMEMINADY